MLGFNYGGGQGDGTGWSSERGNGPAPGGGSHGNAGNNNGSTGSGNGMTNPALSVAVNKTVGDNLVRSFGMDPKQFVGYFLREDGHVLGITTYSLGDAYGVDLGFAQPTPGGNGGNGAGTPNAAATYQGNVSPARVAALRQVIADNYALANSTQAGTRITRAKQAVVDAKRELALIDYTIQGRAQQTISVEDAVKSTADFMAEITGRFGQQAAELAQEFADNAKGKTLRNVDEVY